MRTFGNNDITNNSSRILRYPRKGLYFLSGLACISIIALGTMLLSRNEERLHKKQ